MHFTGAIAVLVLAVGLGGCDRNTSAASDAASPASNDSAFAALQERGASPAAMGVDQYSSVHRFVDLPDGGRIELQRAVDDSAGVEQIRSHLRHIEQAFSQGDFQIPGFVHGRAEVPGTQVMAERREAIEYEFRELPKGGELRIRTRDSEAVAAIHSFLAFQRGDHRTNGHAQH